MKRLGFPYLAGKPYRKAILSGIALAAVAFLLTDACTTSQPLSFNRDIRPILNENCLACHGGVKKQGGFSLLFREEALAETESGLRAIVPGDPDASEMIARLSHPDPEERMPYEKDPLSEEQIDLLRRWISEGATWELPWSYQGPKTNIPVPGVSNPNWIRQDLDAFILSRLDREGLAPAGEASSEVLARRLSLDLTGLPPNRQLAKILLSDTSANGYEQYIDSLLASPHFGEKWASMWLDLARYADSRGYEKDLNRSIWKYRDWVIQAFNRDLPFDQFTVLQLAGDLLPDAGEEEVLPTAFHRNTMANDEGGTQDEEYRVAAVIDRVATSYEVWQGVTMGCVQCHSHPYDPIRHEEFYQSFAFFNNTRDRDIYPEHPNLMLYEQQEREEVKDILVWLEKEGIAPPANGRDGFLHEKKQAYLESLGFRKIEAEIYDGASRFIELTSPDQKSVFQIQDSSWIRFDAIDLTKVDQIGFQVSTPFSGGYIEVCLDTAWGEKLLSVEVRKTGGFKEWKEVKGRIQSMSRSKDLYLCFRRNQDRTQELFRLDWIYLYEKDPVFLSRGGLLREKAYRLAELEPVATPVMAELPDSRARQTHLYERGNWLTPGKVVSPGVPDVLGAIELDDTTVPRLAFAQWLVSTENPLTARVMVNRVWEQVFGTGLVETVEDFGSQGSPPSHPALLDYLSLRFVSVHKWSMKSLLKELVMSATYRQASNTSSEKMRKDPGNRLLSRGARVRLASEQIRDQVLAVAGILDDSLYGPPVLLSRPDRRTADAFGQFKFFAYNPYRRAIYGFWKRSFPNPSMVSFDSPSRSVCASRRIRTNTPLQSLIMLNDSIFFHAAQALAVDMIAPERNSIVEACRYGYEQIMMRPGAPEKIDALKELYDESLVYYQENEEVLGEMKIYIDLEAPTPEFGAMVLVANALLNMDEFVTKN